MRNQQKRNHQGLQSHNQNQRHRNRNRQIQGHEQEQEQGYSHNQNQNQGRSHPGRSSIQKGTNSSINNLSQQPARNFRQMPTFQYGTNNFQNKRRNSENSGRDRARSVESSGSGFGPNPGLSSSSGPNSGTDSGNSPNSNSNSNSSNNNNNRRFNPYSRSTIRLANRRNNSHHQLQENQADTNQHQQQYQQAQMAIRAQMQIHMPLQQTQNFGFPQGLGAINGSSSIQEGSSNQSTPGTSFSTWENQSHNQSQNVNASINTNAILSVQNSGNPIMEAGSSDYTPKSLFPTQFSNQLQPENYSQVSSLPATNPSRQRNKDSRMVKPSRFDHMGSKPILPFDKNKPIVKGSKLGIGLGMAPGMNINMDTGVSAGMAPNMVPNMGSANLQHQAQISGQGQAQAQISGQGQAQAQAQAQAQGKPSLLFQTEDGFVSSSVIKTPGGLIPVKRPSLSLLPTWKPYSTLPISRPEVALNGDFVPGPFSPPLGPASTDFGAETTKNSQNVLAQKSEEYAQHQRVKILLGQAASTTLGTYVGKISTNNNPLIPVLPRMENLR